MRRAQTYRSFDILSFYNTMSRLFDLSLIQDAVQALCCGQGALWSSDKTEGDIIKKELGGLIDIIEEGHQLTDSKVRSRNNAYHQIQPLLHKSKAFTKRVAGLTVEE